MKQQETKQTPKPTVAGAAERARLALEAARVEEARAIAADEAADQSVRDLAVQRAATETTKYASWQERRDAIAKLEFSATKAAEEKAQTASARAAATAAREAAETEHLQAQPPVLRAERDAAETPLLEEVASPGLASVLAAYEAKVAKVAQNAAELRARGLPVPADPRLSLAAAWPSIVDGVDRKSPGAFFIIGARLATWLHPQNIENRARAERDRLEAEKREEARRDHEAALRGHLGDAARLAAQKRESEELAKFYGHGAGGGAFTAAAAHSPAAVELSAMRKAAGLDQ
jgi:hypothetical protein